jgi:hypothetical protein
VALPPLLGTKLHQPIFDTTNPTPAHFIRPKQILIHCINILRERATRMGVHSPNPGAKNAHPGEL